MVNSNQPDELYEEGFIDNLKNGKLSIQKNVVARYNDTPGKAILQIANEYNTTIAKLDEDKKKAMSEIGSGKSMTSKELAHHKHVLERYLARCQSYAGKLWKYDKLIKKGGIISRDITGVYEQVDKAIRGRIRMVENLIKKCDTITTYDDSSNKDPFAESTYDDAIVSFMRAYKEYSDAISEYEPLNMSEAYVVEASKDKRDLNKTEMAIIEKHQKNTEAVKKSKNALQKMKDSLSSAMDSASKSMFLIKQGLTHDKVGKSQMQVYHNAIKSRPYLANREIKGFDFKEYYRSFSGHIDRLKTMSDSVITDPDKFGTVASWEKSYQELFEETDKTTVNDKYSKMLKLKEAISQVEFVFDVISVDIERDFNKFKERSMSKMGKIGVDPNTVETDGTIPNEDKIAKEYVSSCILVLNTYNKVSRMEYDEFKRVLTLIATTIKSDQEDAGSDIKKESDVTESVDLGAILNMSRSPIRGHI